MSRRYWRSIIAAIGIAIAVASPPENKARAQDQNAGAEAEQARGYAFSGFFEEADEHPSLDEPCEQGEDNRSSDLCAQWKAADAAYTSAVWTERTAYIGIAGLVLGTLTLAAAAAAAYYAGVAAVQTKRGADAADRAVRISEESAKIAADALSASQAAAAEVDRAWIRIDVTAGDLVFDEALNRVQLGIRVNIINIGRSPATNVVLTNASIHAKYSEITNKIREMSDMFNRTERGIATYLGFTLFPDETHNYGPFKIEMPLSEFRSSVAASEELGAKGVVPAILICVAYTLPGSAKVRQTFVPFEVIDPENDEHGFEGLPDEGCYVIHVKRTFVAGSIT
jgi:hypothetical protein